MDTGDTAWVLTSTALVLFMTPGLALFYGGMVRSKNVLGMLMQNYIAMGLLAVLWVFVAFSLAFSNAGDGEDHGRGGESFGAGRLDDVEHAEVAQRGAGGTNVAPGRGRPRLEDREHRPERVEGRQLQIRFAYTQRDQ